MVTMATTFKRSEVVEQSLKYFDNDILPAEVFTDKYALKNGKLEWVENSPEQMHHRLAKEFARIEKKYPNPLSQEIIFSLLDKFKYIIPQGSPMFGIGNHYQRVSISNCFVIDIVDSYGGICRTDERIAQVSKRRGGVGLDISPLRPKGMPTKNSALTTDGIVVFMDRFSNTSREVAQCLHGSTKILTKKGLFNIEKVKSGDEVWTENGWVLVKKVIKNKKDTVKIKTQLGSEIICSKDHIFSSMGDEKKIKDIKIGGDIDRIVGMGFNGKDIFLKNIPYPNHPYNNSNRLKRNIVLPTKIDTKLAYILGYMYGDGYVGEAEIDLPIDHRWVNIKKKLIYNIKNVFGVDVAYKKVKGNYDVLRIDSKLIIHFLKSNNILKQKTKLIEFPSCLYTAKKNVLFSFISGYMDADGCVMSGKKNYKFTSINKQFLLNVQNILLAHGVVSKLEFTDRSNNNWNDIYNLFINGFESQKIFKELLCESVKCQETNFKDKHSDWTQTIYTIKDFNSNSSRHSYIIDNNQFLSYKTTRKLLNDLNIKKDVLLIRDKVVSITKYEKKSDVYDLVLKNTHLFSANGFYVHNSGRRGALMITISVHHPEVLNFIQAKRDLRKVTGANISIRVSDEFMQAVKKDKTYEQRWPVDSKKPIISQMVRAKEIWDTLVKCNFQSAEPGILFWNNIIKNSPSDSYADNGFMTTSTNPCGELPASPHNSCILLLQNLTSYVNNPFSKDSKFDEELFIKNTKIAQRLIDDMVDLEIEAVSKIIDKIKNDPEPECIKANEMNLWEEIKDKSVKGRRTGLGITGLGDCLAMLNIKYGSKESMKIVDTIFSILRNEAYRSSVEMAKERGAFPIWDAKKEKDNEFLNRLPDDILKEMKKYGRRNIALLTVSPAGSVSTLTRTSSGFEPVFKTEYTRRKKITTGEKEKPNFVDAMGDGWKEYSVTHHGLSLFKQITNQEFKDSPYCGSQAEEIDYMSRVEMQAIATKYIDHAISSTINLSHDTSVETISNLYIKAWESGCKGLTTYRSGSRDGVLIDTKENLKNSCKDCNEANDQFADLLNAHNRPPRIILSSAPKRLVTTPCDIHRSSVGGREWLFFVGMLDKIPYEVFGGDGEKFTIPHKYKEGWVIKNGKVEGVTQYNLILGSLTDDNEKLEFKGIAKHFNNYKYGAFTRAISLSIRHGVAIKYICEQITKTGVEGDLFSFQRALSRVLKKYIAEGEKTNMECPTCHGTDIIYKNGCPSCQICGYSQCS